MKFSFVASSESCLLFEVFAFTLTVDGLIAAHQR